MNFKTYFYLSSNLLSLFRNLLLLNLIIFLMFLHSWLI
ncbi:hypothetical protein SLEP1_g42963 [Rubroshorea leprosula]|uniref:NADH dehydrogenase subunit 2 n=1 Tax=Rubroshorea leprosula TaxID=152421 RepID=A0AAV5LCF5_9ROSI|nr:hypothetical protein SLEP1_g42963 [Rubroshorea leprosula]